MQNLKFIFIFCFCMASCGVSFAQLSGWEMDNFKKMEKLREKKMKQKGPVINTKRSSHKARKTRRAKNPFYKKKYKVVFLINEHKNPGLAFA